MDNDKDILEMNYQAARYGIEQICEEYPYGGINRYDVVNSLDKNILDSQFNFFRSYKSLLYKEERTLKEEAKIMFDLKKLKGAFCGDLAHFTKFEILKKFPNVSIEMVILSRSKHQLIVIGREKNSNPSDIDTWGGNAVLCDPWARKIYQASEFWKVRYSSNNIEFFELVNGHIQVKVKVHYLEGTPEVLEDYQYFPEHLLDYRNNKLS